MNYTQTHPCAKCPFRTDIEPFLTPARASEIVASLEQSAFPCHETLDYCRDDECEDESGHGAETENTQHCAGALIMLEHVDQPSQMMRICERIGVYDRRKLNMDAPVFKRPIDFIKAQSRKRAVGRKKAKVSR